MVSVHVHGGNTTRKLLSKVSDFIMLYYAFFMEVIGIGTFHLFMYFLHGNVTHRGSVCHGKWLRMSLSAEGASLFPQKNYHPV